MRGEGFQGVCTPLKVYPQKVGHSLLLLAPSFGFVHLDRVDESVVQARVCVEALQYRSELSIAFFGSTHKLLAAQ